MSSPPRPPGSHERGDGRYAFIPGTATGPTVIGGDGVYLHTADGRRILDGAGGAIVGNIGWGRREVADAVASAMATGGYVIPMWPTPSRLALHDRLVESWLPDGFTQVFFTSGGSESTDSALRLARAYQVGKGRTGRWKVIGRHPSYHGMTLGTMAAASHSVRQAGYEPLLLPFPKVPWNDADAVVKVIEQEDPATIAAFVAEPITGAAGACLTASDEYWRVVTQVCKDNDILLIADEVMTGLGRTGRTWGHQLFPIEPDVIVGGKGLGGGYVPMGAVATRADVADVLRDAGFMFFTFTGTDAMCAGADAVLHILEREHLVERCAAMGELLHRRLHDELDDHPHVVEVRGRGLFAGIELVRDRDTVAQFPAAARVATVVVGQALQRDVWVYPAGSGPVRDAVMLGPPFVITAEQIDTIVAVLRESIDAAVRLVG
jgi:adenosylmethionine-8-amino-7-oxononanoate aminotransferase